MMRAIRPQSLFGQLAALIQGGLVLLMLVLAYLLLRRVLKPMRQLSSLMVRRDPGVLTPLPDLLPARPGLAPMPLIN